MIKFVFLVVLASLPISSFSMGLHKLSIPYLQEARLGSIAQLCNLFCGEGDYYDYEDYHDYDLYFFRAFDEKIEPRIFCGLCKKKMKTTTPKSSTSSSTSEPSTSSTTTPKSSTSSSTTEPTTTTTTKKIPATLLTTLKVSTPEGVTEVTQSPPSSQVSESADKMSEPSVSAETPQSTTAATTQ